MSWGEVHSIFEKENEWMIVKSSSATIVKTAHVPITSAVKREPPHGAMYGRPTVRVCRKEKID